MLDKEFDKILKSKLDQLSVNHENDSWQFFSEKFAADLEGGQDPLDNIIKDKLETPVEVPVSAGWASFADKFENQLSTDEHFDSDLKENIEHYRADYNPSHWAILKARLERALYLRQRLVTSKLLEMVMAILLFVSFVNYMPFMFPQDDIKVDLGQIAMATSIENKNESTRQNSDDPISTKITNKEHLKNTNLTANRFDQNRSSIEVEKTTEVSIVETRQLTTSSNNNLSSSLAVPQKPIQSIIPSTEFGKSGIIQRIGRIPSVSLGLVSFKKDKNLILPETQISNVNVEMNNSGFWLHTTFASNRNFIESSFGTPIGEENYKTISTGFSAGLALGYEFNRIGVSLGLNLGNYAFDAQPNEDTYLREMGSNTLGEYKVSLKSIEHNTLNIPINIEYALNNPNSSWRISAAIGTDLKIINATNYSISNELINEFTVPGGIPTPWTNPEKFASMTFIEGWSEGGRFNDVASLNLNAGISLQKTFGNALAVYFQPKYHIPVINGSIDPTGDKISRLAFNFGMKYRLQNNSN